MPLIRALMMVIPFLAVVFVHALTRLRLERNHRAEVSPMK